MPGPAHARSRRMFLLKAEEMRLALLPLPLLVLNADQVAIGSIWLLSQFFSRPARPGSTASWCISRMPRLVSQPRRRRMAPLRSLRATRQLSRTLAASFSWWWPQGPMGIRKCGEWPRSLTYTLMVLSRDWASRVITFAPLDVSVGERNLVVGPLQFKAVCAITCHPRSANCVW